MKDPHQREIELLRSKLWKQFHEACHKYQLLEDGDKILMGLSGGKDSLLLLEFLGKQAKIYVPKIEVIAVHIRVKNRPYLSDLKYLEDFCQTAGIPLLIRDTEIHGEEKKDPCFLCSWQRRKTLIQTAEELECNKIALGHHKDDAVETLLMNLIFQGSFCSIPPLLELEKMPLTWIRPLCLMEERNISMYAQWMNYQKQKQLCPFEKVTSRNKVKELIHQLEQLNPDVRSSLWGAMENIKSDYLPQNKC